MQDITLHDEDKKLFICNVKKEKNKYLIKYASGNEVLSCIRTYDQYMQKMEKQFLEYKDAYLRCKYNAFYITKTLKSLVDILLVVESLIFVSNINKVDLDKILVIILALLFTILSYAVINKKNKILKDKIGNVLATEYYLQNKEHFQHVLIDEENFLKYQYDIVDMNNIDKFNSKEELIKYKEINEVEKKIKLVRSD